MSVRVKPNDFNGDAMAAAIAALDRPFGGVRAGPMHGPWREVKEPVIRKNCGRCCGRGMDGGCWSCGQGGAV